MRFPLRLAPYLRIPRRLLEGQVSLGDIALKKDVICPEEVVSLRAPVFLPEQINKITARKFIAEDALWFRTETDQKDQIDALLNTEFTYPASIAYHLKNAVLLDGSIYVGAYRYPFHPKERKSIFKPPANCADVHLKEAALASTYLGTRYFGDWLTEDCSRYALAETYSSPLCVRTIDYADKSKYNLYFNQNFAPIDRARIDYLTIFDDVPQNSCKRERYRRSGHLLTRTFQHRSIAA